MSRLEEAQATHWIIALSPLAASLSAEDEDDDAGSDAGKLSHDKSGTAETVGEETDKKESSLERIARLFPDFTICDEDEPDLARLAQAIDQWLIDPAPFEFYRRLLWLRTMDAASAAGADAMFSFCAHQIADAEGNSGRQAWWRAVQTLVGPPELSQYYAFIVGSMSAWDTLYIKCINSCRRARLLSTYPIFPVAKLLEEAPFAKNYREEGSPSSWLNVSDFLKAVGVFNVHPPETAPMAVRWMVDVCRLSMNMVKRGFECSASTATACQILEDTFPGAMLEKFVPVETSAMLFVLKLRLANMGLPVDVIPQTEDYAALAMRHNKGELVKWINSWIRGTDLSSFPPTLRFIIYCSIWSAAKPSDPINSVLTRLRKALEEDTAHRASNVRCLQKISARIVEHGHITYLIKCALFNVVVWPAVGTIEFKNMIARCAVSFAAKDHRVSRAELVLLLSGDGTAHIDILKSDAFFHGFGAYLRELQLIGGSFGNLLTNVLEPICQWLLCSSFTAASVRKHQETVQAMTFVLECRIQKTPVYAGRVMSAKEMTEGLTKQDYRKRKRDTAEEESTV